MKLSAASCGESSILKRDKPSGSARLPRSKLRGIARWRIQERKERHGQSGEGDLTGYVWKGDLQGGRSVIRSPWVQAARLQLHTIGFTPLLLGNIAAWYEHGCFDPPRFIVSLLIGLSIHLITAFVNDAADIQTDEANLSRTPFSGGSGVVVEGHLLRADLIKGASWAALLAVVLTGVMIFVLDVHWGILLFVGWGIASARSTASPP